MLIDVPTPKHAHRNLIYDDDQLTVFCPGCGFLWRARAWTDDNGFKRVEPYRPVGIIRDDDSDPF